MEDSNSTTGTTPPLLLVCVALAVSAAATLLLLSLRVHVNARRNRKSRLPPGPPGLLFLAKFLALRRSIFDLVPVLRDLHARHGPVISLRLARTLVFVADRRLAHRALVQGGATFADRPPLADPGLLFTAGARDISSSPYGAYWRLLRRNLAGDALQPPRVARFAPARRLACDGLVAGLRARGAAAVELRPLLRRAMFDLLVYMCFGARLGRDALDEVEALQHRVLLSVTSFPLFAFFPAVTKRLFRGRWEENVALRRRHDELFTALIHAAPARAGAAGGGGDGVGDGDDAPPCYADSLRALRVPEGKEDGGGSRPLTDAEMVSLCSEFLNGGTDTTVTLVEWIMAELVNHPEVQAKVREEVSAATEEELLKSGDLHATPYLRAVVMEGLRLHPPGHFVLPHSVRSDDADIGGYTVPKGAEVNFLVAEMGRDEAVWAAPREFRPDRFLDGGEGCGVDITCSREIRMMPFGAGRRMCPGYALGMHHAAYFVARMVRDLEWRPEVDGAAAVDMDEVLEFTTVMKRPLRARIVDRVAACSG